MKTIFLAASLALALTQINAGAQDADVLLARSRGIALQLAQELGAELQKEMSRSGPRGAIGVCKTAAPEIAGRLSRELGARVARISLKTRNPMIGLPDQWEQDVLKRFDQSAAAGESAETLEFGEVVTESQGRYYRYVRAIPVQPQCLACHGGSEISTEILAALSRDYPHDRARGYSLGQVRGAITIKQPLQ